MKNYNKTLIMEIIEIITYKFDNRASLDSAFHNLYTKENQHYIHVKLLTYLFYIENGFILPSLEDLTPTLEYVPSDFRPTEYIRNIDYDSSNFISLVGKEYFLYRFLIKNPTPLMCFLNDVCWNATLLKHYLETRFNCEFGDSTVRNSLSRLKKNINFIAGKDCPATDYDKILLYLYTKHIREYLNKNKNTINQICLGAIVNTPYTSTNKKNKHTMFALPTLKNTNHRLKHPTLEAIEYYFNYPPFHRDDASVNCCIDEIYLFNAIPNNYPFFVFTDGVTQLRNSDSQSFESYAYNINSFTFDLLEKRKRLNMNVFIVPKELLTQYNQELTVKGRLNFDCNSDIPEFISLFFNYFNRVLDIARPYLYDPSFKFDRSSVTVLFDDLDFDANYFASSYANYTYLLEHTQFPSNVVDYGRRYFINTYYCDYCLMPQEPRPKKRKRTYAEPDVSSECKTLDCDCEYYKDIAYMEQMDKERYNSITAMPRYIRE